MHRIVVVGRSPSSSTPRVDALAVPEPPHQAPQDRDETLHITMAILCGTVYLYTAMKMTGGNSSTRSSRST